MSINQEPPKLYIPRRSTSIESRTLRGIVTQQRENKLGNFSCSEGDRPPVVSHSTSHNSTHRNVTKRGGGRRENRVLAIGCAPNSNGEREDSGKGKRRSLSKHAGLKPTYPSMHRRDTA